MQVAAPRWEWKWNPNTILFLVAIAGGVLSWGYAVARWEGALTAHAERIITLEASYARLDSEAVSRTRTLDNHELRIANVEKQATDAATAMRAVETTLNALTTDIRVVREILQRLEAGQNGRSHN